MRIPAAQPLALRLRGGAPGTGSPLVLGASPAARAGAGRRSGPMWPVLTGCLALAALTLLFPSTPTYDPWAWILWGREITHLDLVTTGGPSWKPLPMLFTIPFSVFGDHAAPLLWVWIARAGGLLAVAMAFRVTRRLVGGLAGVAGGLLAGAFLFSSFRFVRDAALGNSEALLAGLVLWAFERHLDGRRDHALWLGLAAALLRPEAWPFLGLYGLWLWFRDPELRLRVVVVFVAIPVLWFLPEIWGSGDALRAQSRATKPTSGSAAFAQHPGLEVLRRFANATIVPVVAGTAVALVDALRRWRRERGGTLVLGLALAGLAWLALVAAMTERGYAGNQRYLIVTTAVVCVLGGVGFGRLLEGLWRIAGRLTGSPRRALAITAAVTAAGVIAGVPVIRTRVDNGRVTLDKLRYEASLWQSLDDAVNAAGGRRRVLACGNVYSGPYQTQMVAYELRLHGIQVGWIRTPPPGVAFRTRTVPGGPEVVRPSDGRYRPVARSRRWAIETVPPANTQGAGGVRCPAAGPRAPAAPLNGPTTQDNGKSTPAAN